jgi:hypothetical protein
MIKIHWDYTDGTEVSYIEGKALKDDFTTCCLDFFNQEQSCDDVIILRKDGSMISRNNIQLSTDKEIRLGHDIRKLLVAGILKFI